MGKKTAGGFYAVGVGRKVGIFGTWTECETSVKGFPGAKFKKFSTESDAQDFVNEYSSGSSKTSSIGVPLKNKSRPGAAGTSSNNTILAKFKKEQSSKIQQASKRRLDGGTILLDSPPSRHVLKRPRVSSTDRKENPYTEGDTNNFSFIVDSDDFVHVYTDGACSQNGRANPKAGVGVWFGDGHPLNLSQPVNGPPTNNNAEIQAARLALEIAAKSGLKKLQINTDSAFLIQCATCWLPKWKSNGWKLSTGGDVKNRIELEKLDKATANIVVQWNKVPAHSGLHGNEMADKLATEGASRY